MASSRYPRAGQCPSLVQHWAQFRISTRSSLASLSVRWPGCGNCRRHGCRVDARETVRRFIIQVRNTRRRHANQTNVVRVPVVNYPRIRSFEIGIVRDKAPFRSVGRAVSHEHYSLFTSQRSYGSSERLSIMPTDLYCFARRRQSCGAERDYHNGKKKHCRSRLA